jgi:hypothetical protein
MRNEALFEIFIGFGLERVAKVESLQEIIADMNEPAENSVESR